MTQEQICQGHIFLSQIQLWHENKFSSSGSFRLARNRNDPARKYQAYSQNTNGRASFTIYGHFEHPAIEDSEMSICLSC